MRASFSRAGRPVALALPVDAARGWTAAWLLPLAFVLLALNLVSGAAWGQDDYFWSAGRRVPLEVHESAVAVQLEDGVTPNALMGRVAADWRRTETGPDGIVVLRGTSRAIGRSARAVAGVAAILPTYGREQAVTIVTDELAVQFQAPLSAADQEQLEQAYGIEFVRPLGSYAPHGYLCRRTESATLPTLDIANDLYEHERVRFSHPNFLVKNERFQVQPQFIPNDPLFAQQWHLQNTGQNGSVVGADANVPDAWDITRGDPDIIVGISDDGLEATHEDFALAGKIRQGYDFGNDDPDPSPFFFDDNHGTAVAGVSAADGNNSVGVSGAAPDCSLMGLRFSFPFLADSEIAASFAYAADNGAAVVNCSWGPVAPPGVRVPLSDLQRQAIDYCTTTGRGGLGTIVLYAAGNSGVDCDLHERTTYDKVITVTASTDVDTKAYYTNFGTKVDVCAPSNGGIAGITTVDRAGANGYNTGGGGDYADPNYTNAFGGTSSATPLVSGVIALMLSANPYLPREQVQQILQDTAVKIDPAGGNYDSNGHSKYYGYGKVDAAAAVAAAANLVGVPVTLSVQTTNVDEGGRPTSSATPVPVSYQFLNQPREAEVFDGQAVEVRADAGTQITFPAEVSRGNQRWIRDAAVTINVDSSDGTESVDYLHQIQRPVRPVVQAGAAPLEGANTVEFRSQSMGQAQVRQLTGAGDTVWLDTGSTYRMAERSSGSNDNERWVAREVTEGQATTDTAEIVVPYFHQLQVVAELVNTTPAAPVSTLRRRLFGVDANETGLHGTFEGWVDNRSTLQFSANSDEGSDPQLAADGQHEFVVERPAELPARYRVVYGIKALPRTSTLRLEPAVAPANGRTPVRAMVTIRDSSGDPVSGVDASRVSLQAEPADSISIANPGGRTDATGRLVFEVTRDLPGVVELSATLDGIAVGMASPGAEPATAQATFQELLHVTLPVAGVYLLSFPVTVPDSHEVVRNFDVTPTPPLLARFNTGANRYEHYQPARPNPAFNIVPGRGFFLKTTAGGQVDLPGEWAMADEHLFEMPQSGYHQLGNPMATSEMRWRLGDFEVLRDGVLLGTLADTSTWTLVAPYAWAFNGQDFEMVVDPNLPGAEGMRNKLEVFEGFFWKAASEGIVVRYRPGSGVGRAAEPVSPGNFGFSISATTPDGGRATAVLGAQRQALRAEAAPPAPEGGGSVRLDIVTPGDGRAAADWVAGPVIRPQTWTLAVNTRQATGDVTLSWAHLARQLPRGYRARLRDLSTGSSVLLNTRGGYTFAAGEGERQFEVTVLPRSEQPLQVLSFAPTVGRSRSVDFDLNLTGEAEVLLRVTSLSGRLVAETAPVVVTGPARVAWDGRDAEGRRVPRGVYQVTLIAHNDAGELARAVRTVNVP